MQEIKLFLTPSDNSSTPGEFVWAIPQTSNTARLDSLPFGSDRFTLGDLVKFKGDGTVLGVIHRAARNRRVCYDPAATKQGQTEQWTAIKAHLEPHGIVCESAFPGFFAMAVPLYLTKRGLQKICRECEVHLTLLDPEAASHLIHRQAVQRTDLKSVESVAGSKPHAALADSRNQQLENKLLAIGGKSVVCQAAEPYIQELLDCGQVFKQGIKLCGGKDHGCHQNCAMKWDEDPSKYTLVTGYGLKNNVWHQHSWLLDGRQLIETTTSRDVYFGVALDTEESFRFWRAHYPRDLTGNAKQPPRELNRKLDAVVRDLFARQEKNRNPGRLASAPSENVA